MYRVNTQKKQTKVWTNKSFADYQDGALPKNQKPGPKANEERSTIYQKPKVYQNSKANHKANINQGPKNNEGQKINEESKTYQGKKTNKGPKTNEAPKTYQGPQTYQGQQTYQKSRSFKNQRYNEGKKYNQGKNFKQGQNYNQVDNSNWRQKVNPDEKFDNNFNQGPKLNQGTKLNQGSKPYQGPKTYQAPKTYQSPKPYQGPRTYQAPNQYQGPKTYQGPKSDQGTKQYQASKQYQAFKQYQTSRIYKKPGIYVEPLKYKTYKAPQITVSELCRTLTGLKAIGETMEQMNNNNNNNDSGNVDKPNDSSDQDKSSGQDKHIKNEPYFASNLEFYPHLPQVYYTQEYQTYANVKALVRQGDLTQVKPPVDHDYNYIKDWRATFQTTEQRQAYLRNQRALNAQRIGRDQYQRQQQDQDQEEPSCSGPPPMEDRFVQNWLKTCEDSYMQKAQNFQLELEKQQQRQKGKQEEQRKLQDCFNEEFQRRRQQEKAHNEIMVRLQELKELEKRLESETEKQEQLEDQWQAMVAQYQDKKRMEAAYARRKLEIKQRLEQIEACRKERDLLQARLSNEAAKAARRVGQEATRYYEDQQYDFLCGPKNVEGQGDSFKMSTEAKVPRAPLPSELPQPMAAMFSSPGNGNGNEAETDSGNGSKYPEETGGEASSSSSSQIGDPYLYEWLKTCRESYQSSKWELPSQEQDLAPKKRKQQDVAGDQKKPKKEPEMGRQQDMVRKELLERIQEVKELQERLENEMKQQQECMDSSQRDKKTIEFILHFRDEMEEYKAASQLGQQRWAEQIEACRQERELLQARLRNERAKTAQRVGRETRQSDIRYGSKDFNLGGCNTNYVTSTDLSKMPTVPTVPRAPLPSELPQPMAATLKGNGKASTGKGNGNEDGKKYPDYPEETYAGEED